MGLSLQRTILIIAMVRFIAITLIFAVAHGQTYNLQGDITTLHDIQEERSAGMMDFFLSDGPNVGGDYVEKTLADGKYGFQMGGGSYLLAGLTGVITPQEGIDDYEEELFFWLNVLNILITMIAAFEAFQILITRKNT